MKFLACFITALLLIVPGVLGEPIQLHPQNSHYLLFHSKPVILITSAEHYGAVINLDFDYVKYLNTLHADGMNYTRIFSGAYIENTKSFGIEKNTLAPLENRVITPWARSGTPGYINGGNKFDLDSWNSDYFARLKDFIAEAGKRDIIVEVTLFSSIYTDDNWAYSPLHPSNNINGTRLSDRKNAHTMNNGNLLPYQEKLTRKIVRELNEFDNIFYEIQNEPWSDQTVPSLYLNPFDSDTETWYKRSDLASPASLEWQDTITAYITGEESALPNKHLIAQNYCNFKYPVRDVNPAISIMNFHYAWPEAVTWNYGWNRVINFDESGFAEKSDTVYRKQAWNFILSGGGIYNNLDYSFVAGYEDGTFVADSPGHGGTVFREQMSILRDFMESFDFIMMKPDPTVIRKAPGTIPRILAETGEQYAVYCDGGGQCDLDLDLPRGTYLAEWIDTKTGVVSKSESITSNGGISSITSPEFEDDIALRIVKAE